MSDLPKARHGRTLCAEPLEGRWLLSAPARDAPPPTKPVDADRPIPLSELPNEVTAALLAMFPGARPVDADVTIRDGDRQYDVGAEYEGHSFDATLTSAGEVVLTEDLPAELAKATSAPPAPSPQPAQATPTDSSDETSSVTVVGVQPADTRDTDVPLSPSKLPAPVAATLHALYPGATVLSAEASDDDEGPEVGVRGVFNGKPIDVALTPDGRVIETQKALSEDELPAPVRDWVRQNFPGARVDDAQAVTKDGDLTYELQITPPGGAAVEAVFQVGPSSTDPSLTPQPVVSGTTPLPVISNRPVPGPADHADPRTNPADALPPSARPAGPARDAEVNAAARATGADRGSTEEGEQVASTTEARADETTLVELPQNAPVVALEDPLVITRAAHAFLGAAAWAPRAVGALAEVLPADVGEIERGFGQVLRDIEALARGGRGAPSRAGAAEEFAALAALVAGAQLVVLESKKRRGGPPTIFNPVDVRRGRAQGAGRR